MKHLKRIFILLLCSFYLFIPNRISAQEIFDIINKTQALTEDDFAKYDIGVYSYLDIKEELTRPLRDIRDDYPTPTLRKRIFILSNSN